MFNGKRKSGSWEEYEKKMSTKRVKGSIKAKKTPEFITVQQMSSEPIGRVKKYEPLDTCDFADFSDFTEITIENIKETYENHYGAPSGSCDTLLGDKEPSCFSTEQIASKKVFFLWFVNPQAIKCLHNDKFSYSKKTKSNQSEPFPSLSTKLPPVTSNITVPSLPITDLMKARKLVKLPEEEEETLMLESYSIQGKSWEKMQHVKRKICARRVLGSFQNNLFKPKLYQKMGS